MIKTVKVALTIRDHVKGSYLTIPVVPETIPYTSGSKQANSVNVLNLGAVDFLGGVSLDTFQIDSFFPGRYDPSYCQIPNIHPPLTYRKVFADWKEDGTPLQVICPAAGINTRMTLREFEVDLQGFEGDLYYRAKFTEAKTVKPKKLTAGGKLPAKGKKTPAERPKTAKNPAPKTYTVKAGDSLTKIAKQFGIKDWKNGLYIPNKAPKGPLGSNPDKLSPGMKLKLP